jgi:hypothetical protein
MDRVAKCGAHSRRTGKPCQQPAMPNGRCRLHGGKSLAGIAHPGYKDGTYSKFPGLPISLKESFEIARNNPELLNLTDDIALMYSRFSQLIEKIDIEDAEQRWKDISEQMQLLKDARARKDGYAYSQAWASMEDLVKTGGKDFMVWNDIMKVTAHIQKAITQEQKRRMDMHALISTDQAVSFVSEILMAIREEVKDLPGGKEVLQKIHIKTREAMERRPQFGAGVKE